MNQGVVVPVCPVRVQVHQAPALAVHPVQVPAHRVHQALVVHPVRVPVGKIRAKGLKFFLFIIVEIRGRKKVGIAVILKKIHMDVNLIVMMLGIH